MREMGKVVGINLAVLLVLTGVFMAIDTASNAQGGTVLGGMLILVPLQTVGCFITALVSFIMGKQNYGLAFIVAALAVAVIGFSVCWGGLMISSNGSFI